ncbi:hypothetical protein HD554DRAFT_2081328 [Boletus coccyginus]|nr:hypothetical protein HD554DRAFT_2081328 [Boletus coccyginus]
MPVVPDGVYKIFNVQYPTQVADLVNGGPGPIDGRTDRDAYNDKWKVKNTYQGVDSNEITIESVTSPGTYAYTDQAQVRALGGGGPLIGSSLPATKWTVVKNSAEPGKYRIQSPNSVYIWQLPVENTHIILSQYLPGLETNKAKWTFVPA